MRTLHIGTDQRGKPFKLPLELVTTSLAILAKKRVGKSYTAAVFAEELMVNRQPVVIIDITGAHWGLKSSADGKSEKFPVVIFGGRHADVPLEENAGMVVASAIATLRFSAILDFSLMTKSGMKRFLQAFLEEFYRINVEPIHLICDEADRYCPQQPQGDEAKLVAAMDDIVSRGGIKGIGVSIISQRSAKVNKNIVTQCELLIALRIVHPLDAKTIMEWVEMHASEEQAAEMLKSLPNLPIGTAWFWWPGAPGGDIFERIKVRTRETFDSGATPKAGETRIQPKAVAKVDVAKLGADIQATVKKAKDNDPRELKTTISKLQGEIAQLIARDKMREQIPAKVVSQEIPVLGTDDRKKLKEMEELLHEVFERLTHVGTLFTRLRDDVVGRVDKMKVSASLGPVKVILPAARPSHLRPTSEMPQARPTQFTEEGTLPEGEKRILTAVAQHPDGCSREQLTVLTGYKKSSRDTYLQRLRTRGCIEQRGDRIVRTDHALVVLGADYELLPTGADLRDYWLQRLPTGEKRILEILIKHPGDYVDRDSITEATGYLKSSRDTYIQRLSSRELAITTRDGVKASDNLF